MQADMSSAPSYWVTATVTLDSPYISTASVTLEMSTRTHPPLGMAAALRTAKKRVDDQLKVTRVYDTGHMKEIIDECLKADSCGKDISLILDPDLRTE